GIFAVEVEENEPARGFNCGELPFKESCVKLCKRIRLATAGVAKDADETIEQLRPRKLDFDIILQHAANRKAVSLLLGAVDRRHLIFGQQNGQVLDHGHKLDTMMKHWAFEITNRPRLDAPDKLHPYAIELGSFFVQKLTFNNAYYVSKSPLYRQVP